MSLGICFIHNGAAYITSDKRSTLLNNNGENTPFTQVKNKLFKKGNVWYTVLGAVPLTNWVHNSIDNLDRFDINKIVTICKEQEKRFWDSLSDNLKQAKWLKNGDVELLSVLWACNEPQIGVISSDDNYIPTIYREEGKLLGKSAVETDTMLSIILKHFEACHPSIESILSHIFQEANSIDSAISKEFDLVYIPQKINFIYTNKLKAGTIDATKINVTNLNASNLVSGSIDASKINVTNLNASNLVSGSIDASKINVTNLNASNITSGTISGGRISGGTITGVVIDVSTDATVGNSLYIGSKEIMSNKAIYFFSPVQGDYSCKISTDGEGVLNLDNNKPIRFWTARSFQFWAGQYSDDCPVQFKIDVQRDIVFQSSKGSVYVNNNSTTNQIATRGWVDSQYTNYGGGFTISGHNHGIPNGTKLMVDGGGTVTFYEHYGWNVTAHNHKTTNN